MVFSKSKKLYLKLFTYGLFPSYVLKFNTPRFGDKIVLRLQAPLLQRQMLSHNNILQCD